MNKIACRTYAVLCLLYSAIFITVGAVAASYIVNGVPPWLAARLVTLVSMPQIIKALPSICAAAAFLAFIFIWIGVFAWKQRISAMIVGCVFFVFLAFGTNAEIGTTINAVTFVLLTVVAAISARYADGTHVDSRR